MFLSCVFHYGLHRYLSVFGPGRHAADCLYVRAVAAPIPLSVKERSDRRRRRRPDAARSLRGRAIPAPTSAYFGWTETSSNPTGPPLTSRTWMRRKRAVRGAKETLFTSRLVTIRLAVPRRSVKITPS